MNKKLKAIFIIEIFIVLGLIFHVISTPRMWVVLALAILFTILATRSRARVLRIISFIFWAISVMILFTVGWFWLAIIFPTIACIVFWKNNPREGGVKNFSYEDICNMIESAGVKTKIERGNRVFPESDKSSDVIWALSKMMKDVGVNVHLNKNVTDVLSDASGVIVKCFDGKDFMGDKCIIATGGLSYPSTGSTGDGYKFAKNMGHTIEETYPSLVPFNIKEEYCKRLQGLSLKNVTLTIKDENGKVPYSEMGEMLFTHFGISGPLVLSASAYLSDTLKKHQYVGYIDLKPALDEEMLDKRILKDFQDGINKNFNNAIEKLLPKKMIPVIIELAKINPYKKVHEITKEERENLVKIIKNLPVHISGTRGYNEAIITKGGISIKEINPKTMESKIMPNIYFVGEVLDLDAMTGGYNLQIAWSTGYLAGNSIY